MHWAPRSDQIRKGKALRTAIGPCDMSCPARCRAHARPHDVLLAPGPSLPNLRRGQPSLFGRFVGTMAWSDSSATYTSAVRLITFSDRTRSDREVAEVSRFSRILFLDVLRFSDYAGPKRPLANSANARVAFPSLVSGRRPRTVIFRSSIARPADASVYASSAASRRRPQDSRSRWFATSFLVGLFHSLQYAGLSRRSRDIPTPFRVWVLTHSCVER